MALRSLQERTGQGAGGKGFHQTSFLAWNGMEADCRVALIKRTGIQSQPFCLGLLIGIPGEIA